jgi:ubiquinone/menaquinone biosynthesis C-methylase UbiE
VTGADPAAADRNGSIAFDRVAGSYDASRGGMERGRRLAETLAELLPESGPLLEVGVGTGAVSAGLAELGRDMLGVDLSLPMLAVARERLPGRVVAADALHLPVRSGSLAGVCLIHVLHLVADIPATLAEAARVVRPGGALVATGFPPEPVEGDLFEELDRMFDRIGVVRRDDDPDRIVRLGADAGFELVARREEPGLPVTPRIATDLIESRSTSWTWSVDDETWEREVEPTLARVRALPDQDRVRPGPGPTVLAFRPT